MTKKRILPAVFFQRELSGPQAAGHKPERLQRFEEELAEVTGAFPKIPGLIGLGSSGTETVSLDCGGPACGVSTCTRVLDDCAD
jgi:hypothetical protein